MKMYPCPTTRPPPRPPSLSLSLSVCFAFSLLCSVLLLVSCPSYLLSPMCVFSSPTQPNPSSPKFHAPFFVLIGRRRKPYACPDIFVYARNAAHMTRVKREKNLRMRRCLPSLMCRLSMLSTNVGPHPFLRGLTHYYLVTMYQPNPFSFPRENVDTCPSLA